MQAVISDITNTDQSAYIKGRYMGSNIRLVSDVIEYYDKTNNSGILLMLDFRKAFDSLGWNFLLKTLHFFNFGPSFIRWIETIYHKPFACIKNNGYLSDTFDISRGIRQGCPVSALLFVLCVEVLAIKIRNSNTLKGFNFGFENKPVKIAQYADDGILFLNDKNELCSALNILEIFGRMSGLILNIEKCEGLWLGRSKFLQTNCKLFGIKWPEQFRCLGIYLGHNKQLNERKNFTEKIDQIEETLKNWEKRELSLIGRVQVIKTFALSKLVFPATLLHTPEHIIKRFNTILFKFLWRSKDKVKRIKVIQDMKNGGLNMIDLQSFIKSLVAGWILRIQAADPNIYSWVQLPKHYLQKLHEVGLNLRFNFDESVVFLETDNVPSFYREAFKYYNKAFVSTKDDFEKSIMSQPLWGNKFITHCIRCRKNVLFLRNWIRGGIRKVGDLKFKHGILDETFIFQKITCKTNLYTEIMLVKNALRPYTQSIIQGNNDTSVFTKVKLLKSKDIYNTLKNHLTCNANMTGISNYLIPFCNRDVEVSAFEAKVALEGEIKLKEFNFKLLHGCLPCNRNLMKWNIKDNDHCDVCGESQTLEHLLYECCYVQPLWHTVEVVFNTDITYRRILGIEEDFDYDSIATILCFLIYKEWLLLSLENKKRNSVTALEYFKCELTLRQRIYEKCECIKLAHKNNLRNLIENL